MENFQDIDSLPWGPVRPELTQGVTGKTLLDGPTKVVLTRVEPGGRFSLHRDPYGHLFYILEGHGHIQVGDRESAVSAGFVVQVEPGELHGYVNLGPDELLLLSLNLPD